MLLLSPIVQFEQPNPSDQQNTVTFELQAVQIDEGLSHKVLQFFL